MDDAAEVPWDALREGVGRFDGERLWPRNAALRRWLADAGLAPELVDAESVPFAAVPLCVDERCALLAGEPVSWTSGGRHWQLRRVGAGAHGSLLAEDVTALRAAEAQALAAARARALAGAAGTFVHDLNNHLNLALALLAQVRSMGVSADDARLCDDLASGVQLGANLSRALARLLARGFDRRDRADFGIAVVGALAVIAKTCAQRGIQLDGDAGPAGVEVRAGAGELDGLLVQMLMAATDAWPQRLAVRSELLVAVLAGGRERPCVRLRVDVVASSKAPAAVFAATALVRPGSLRDLASSWHPGQALAPLGLLVRRLGGEFTVEAHGACTSLVTILPVVPRA